MGLTIERLGRNVRRTNLSCNARTQRGQICTKKPTFFVSFGGNAFMFCAQHTYKIETATWPFRAFSEVLTDKPDSGKIVRKSSEINTDEVLSILREMGIDPSTLPKQ